MLDADCQTNPLVTTKSSPVVATSTSSVDALQLNQIHMNLVSRINELEIQNYDLLKIMKELRSTMNEFKAKWEVKTLNEKDSDLLLRNIGILN